MIKVFLNHMNIRYKVSIYFLFFFILNLKSFQTIGQDIYDDKKVHLIDGKEYKSKIYINDEEKVVEIITYSKKTNDSLTFNKFGFDELFRGYNIKIYNSIIRLQGDSNGFLLYDFINKEKFYTKMWFHRNNENLNLGIFNPVLIEETQELLILDEHLNIIKKLRLNPINDNITKWSIEESDVMKGVIKLNKYSPIKMTLNKTVQGFTYFVKTNKLQKNVSK